MTTLGNNNGATVQTTTLAPAQVKPIAGRAQGLLSANKQSELVDRLKDGETVADVARALGIGAGTVVRYAKSLGVELDAQNTAAVTDETTTEDVTSRTDGGETAEAKKPRKARKGKAKKVEAVVGLAPLTTDEQQLIGWLITSGLNIDKARDAIAAHDRWVHGAKPIDKATSNL